MKYAKSEALLPLALNLGIQWSGHRTARGSGRPAAPLPSPPRQPRFSGARKCEPALLASLPACCSTNPPNPHFCTPRAPPLSHLCAVGLQARRCCGRPRVPASQTSVRAAACPPSGRAGRTATGRLSPSECGARAGGESPRGAAAPVGWNSPEDTEEPDRLELLDAAIAVRPARRFPLSPGADAAAAALARPLAASAAPSPWQSPGDAQKAPASGLCLHFLLRQMTRCCRRYLFVVSVPLGAFARCSPGVGGRWEPREAEGRPERPIRASRPAPAAVRAPQRAAGTRAPGRPRVPPPAPRGLPPPRRHFRLPGQRQRETDRQSDLPLLPPPQLLSRAHKGRRGDAGAPGLARRLRAWQLLRRGLEAAALDCWAGGTPARGAGPRGAGEAARGRGASVAAVRRAAPRVWGRPEWGVGGRWWVAAPPARLGRSETAQVGCRGWRRGH